MKIEIIDKKSGDRRDSEGTQSVVIDRPSIILLKLAPENVARFERRGDDLVLILKDGQEIPIFGFFVKYPDEDSAEQASSETTDATDATNVATDNASVEELSRNDLVLEDDNGVVWWGQYPEQWSEFHFTEIEWNDGGFTWWPWLLGALGGVAAGTLGGNSDGGQGDPPVAVDDSVSTDEDTPVSGNVLPNDSDPDGDALTVTTFTVDGTTYTAGNNAAIAGVGTLTLDSDGGYTFTPDANWSGTVPTVTYTISDGEGGEDTADLVITVDPVTDLIAADDSNTTNEDTPVDGTVATNDSTTSGGDLTFAKASDPTNGTVVVNSDGTYTYTPNTNYNGTDSFTYTVTDADSGESLTQTVTITIDPVNDAPETTGTIIDQVNEDAQSITALDVASYFTDVEGDTLTYSASGLPEGLVIDPATGEISGTVDPSASQDGTGGVHNVTVTASDGNGGSVDQTFTWTVTNPVPTASDDAASTDEDTPVSGNVLPNDSDPDGDALTVTTFTVDGDATVHTAGDTVTIAGSGELTLGSDGGYTFTPDANWSGTVPTVTYTISDGEGGEDTADLVITVDPVTDLIAADDSNSTNEDTPVDGTVATNDSTTSGGDLTFAKASDPTNGTVVVNSDGTYTYTPNTNYNGTDSFTYTVTDADSGESLTQTVTITIDPVNDAPETTGTIIDQVNEDAQSITALDVASYFTDVEGDTLTYSASGLPEGLVIDPATGEISGTVDPSASQDGTGGVHNVTVTASDGNGGSVDQTFTWTVTNPVPTASDDAASTDEDTPVSGNVLPNDSDPDGDTLTVTTFTVDGDATVHTAGDTVTIAGSGELTLGSDGGYTFTPDANWSGTVPTVTYTISDGEGGEDTADLVITVDPVTDLIAADDSNTTNEDTPVDGTVATNDSTTSGGDLTFAKASDPTNGTVVVNSDGTYTYTPNTNYNGTDSFTYTVTDADSGESLTQTVTITIDPVNDAPETTGTIIDQVNEDAQSITALDVASYFTDVEGDTLTYSASGLPEGLVIDPATGEISGTVDPSASQDGTGGVHNVTVTASDGNGGSVDQTFTWTVTNPVPTASDDAASTDEDTPVSGNVLPNDSDPDGDTLTVTTFTVDGTTYTAGDNAAIAGVGTLTLGSDGGYTFTPDANWSGTVPTVTYTISDGEGGSDTADLVITVDPVNDAPEATGTIPDQADADADAVTTLNVTSYFDDVEGDTLTYSASGLPEGLVIDPATGEISGTVDPSASQDGTGGVHNVTVTASDGNGGSVDQSFTWTVTNPIPTASDDAATTDEDTAVSGNVLTNDSDPDGDALTVTTFTVDGDATEHTAGDTVTIAGVGELMLGSDGGYTFTPDANWNGTVPTVNYTVSDGEGGSDTADLVITVDPVNDVPVIAETDQSDSVVESGNLDDGTVVPGTPSASGSFTATDADGDTLTWSVLGTPDSTYGDFSIDPATGDWTYTLDNTLPATQALNEGDSIPLTYDVQVDDGNGGTETRTVTMTITGTNDSPVANADTDAVTEAGVEDGGNTATAGVASVTGDVLANDTDVDDGETATLTVSDVSFGGSAGTVGSALTGSFGSLALNADGTYTYTLDNDDPDTQALKQGATVTEEFTYTAVDANGAISTSTLTITVTGTNDQPVITSTVADATGEVTEVGTGETGEDTATGTLTASDVDVDATETWTIAATNGDYGTISIDPATGTWTYTLDNTLAATQNLNDGDIGTETFTARVTDEFGAYREQVITVNVNGSNDDLTGGGNATVTLPEDSDISGTLQDYVSDVDDVLEVTEFTVDADGNGTDESYAPGDTATLEDSDGNILGTLTIAENGDYTFTPTGNYAGDVPTVTYTMAETTGGTGSVTQTLDFGTIKVADAPDLEVDKTVNTVEDTSVSLDLIAPVITDTGTGTGNNDYPERIGEITLAISGDGASGVTLSTGATELTPVGGEVTIVLTDVDHITSVPAEDNANGIYYMTTTEYEALEANPLAENGQDFTVTVSATSYEVDATGAIITGVSGATSTQSIDVDVQAETDGATLASDVTELTFAEDNTINLSDHLTATLTSPDSNPGNDTDGSETYWYTVTDLPVGSVVTIDGTDTTITSTSQEVSSPTNTSSTPPTITVTPPSNFSGDINGVTITLNSQDTDGDSSGTIAIVTSPVTVDLHVNPVAGDVSVEDVTTEEDTPVAFLAGVAVSDTDDGSETINSVSFEVPTDWVVTEPTPSAGWSYGLTGSTATITFDNTLNEADREAILDAFTILPPAHSSADETITLSIETTDSSTVDGAPVTDTATVNRDVGITVTPVAERTDTDSDGVGGNDVTMIDDHVYSTPGSEDTWFDLSTDGSFVLADGWSDADGDEELFAVLTPTLESDTPGDTVIGTQFRYSADGGATTETVTYTGEAIWVPAEYLDTLEVKLPSDVSGTLTIGVQAGTRDTDPDTGLTVEDVSGSATLSMIEFDPVADAVTMALNGRASGVEDTDIPLAIKTTSSDSSETFDVTISGIPNGAKIVYDGTELTVTGGSVTISGFSDAAPLTITPPLNSNDDFQLSVSAVSVDGTDTSTPTATRTIDVSVTGDADAAIVTLPAVDYTTTEEALDSGDNTVALSDLVTDVASADDDGSESATLRITGLTEEFSLTGATAVVTGEGAERVWVVSADDLANVSVVMPENYSGTVNLKVAGVTTENDGDSLTGDLTDVSYTVTPSPEATITPSATLVEDEVTPLNLAIVHQNGDDDEALGEAYVQVGYDSSTYTVHLGGEELSAAGLATTTIAGADYYVIPADQVDALGAMGASDLDGSLGSLDFLYEVIDPSSDGTLAPVTEVKSGTIDLTATPVTDAVDASITGIAMTTATGTTADDVPGDDASPDTAAVTGSGAVTVDLHVDSADVDGSEHLIRVLITDVPDGVTVTGAAQVGGGTWLLVYDESNAQSIGPDGVDVPVEFVVGKATGDGTSAITMTVQGRDRGDDSTSPASTESDSVTWNLDVDLADGEPFAPPLINEWSYNGASGTEDAAFTLDSVIDGVVSTGDPSAAYNYTITVTDLPPGSTVNGMTQTFIDGEEVYTATVTASPGDDSQAALDSLLASISITPPADSNDNNANFNFDAKLTAAAEGGTSVEADTSADMPIIPVTDEAAITVAMNDVAEGTTSLAATITAQDILDGVHGEIVDGKLYVQVATNGNDGGTLTDDEGQTLPLTPVSGVEGVPDGDYYVVDVPPSGGSVDLTYAAADGTVLQPGDVTFTAWAQTQETGANNLASASGTNTAEVVIINNGVTVESEDVTGLESATSDKNNAIELTGLSVALNDDDGSESIQSILLSGLPVGFLLFVGDSAGDATLAAQASNAGGDGTSNTWVLSSDGTLPNYVAILPGENWSGTLTDLAMIVESGEDSLSTTTVDTVPLGTVTVQAVANGLTIDPTVSFGREGNILDLNLNAAMADAAMATVPGDDSVETTTLEIAGLGEHAAFYTGDDLITSEVSYDEATDTYTITGLSQDDLSDLGFVQAESALTDLDAAAGTQVTVTAWTVESGNGDESPPVSDTLTLSVEPVLATTGDDSFIWDEEAIDGRAGTDTVALRYGEDVDSADLANLLSNIEVIDLSVSGENSISGGLSITDVLDITGSSSGTLTINGDNDDTVELSSASEWSTDETVTDGYVEYTSTSGVTLLIDEDIFNSNHVSYAA